MLLSNRIKKIEKSGIRKVFAKALQAGPEAVNLSIGQPHFPVTNQLKILAQKAIDDNYNHYFPTQGYLPLRKKIANKLNAQNNILAQADDIIITNGVSGGLFLLFFSIFNPGDEVILPDPYFVLYKELLEFLEVKIIYWDTYPNFRLSADKLSSLITSKTKAIIINTPNNPTGMVYTKTELTQVADTVAQHKLLLIADEIYEMFDYDKKFFSIASIYDNTVTLNGFSKNLGITGWRLGYAHGPKKIIKAMNKLQMYTFVCAPSWAQIAVNNFKQCFSTDFNYQKNHDFLYQKLSDKYKFNIPEGAFYAFIQKPANIVNFYEKVLAKKLLIVPGKVFSQQNNFFRLSLAVDFEILEKAVKILRSID